MLTDRSISAVVALGYMLVVVFGSHQKDFSHALTMIFISFGSLLLPLACIWFPEEMGEYTGSTRFPHITKSPSNVIRVSGWCLLIFEFLLLLMLLGYFGF